jgi:hypothetical protein
MSDPLVCPARTWESAPEFKGLRSLCLPFGIHSYPETRHRETNFVEHPLDLLK